MKRNTSINRRGFLKGLGATAAGSLMIPTILKKAVFAQDFTTVSLYARLAGSGAPTIALNQFDTDAWICLGDKVELFWVTTQDVGQIDLGDDLGVFAADQGGNENGLNWGSVEVEPTSHASYQIFALDGDFEAGNAAGVRVFNRERAEGPFFPINEDEFFAQRISSATARTDKADEWFANLPSERFSPRLRVKGIKAVGASSRTSDSGSFVWSILKTDENGVEHRFSIQAVNSYQNPFTPAGTDITIPLSGDWSFITRGDIAERKIPFMVEMVCG